jgi:O-antigen ligase
MKLLLSKCIFPVLLITAFFLPLVPVISLFGMGTFAFLVIVTGNFPHAIKSLLENKMLLLMAALYLLYGIGMFYTEDTTAGLHELGSKIPLFLIPLMLPGANMNRKQMLQIGLVFSSGVFILGMIMLAHAAGQYSSGGDAGAFFYAAFTGKWHPTYFAMYLNLAILFFLEYYFSVPVRKPLFVFLSIVLYAWGITLIILASSRMAIFAGALSVLYWTIFTWRKNKGLLLKDLLIILIFPVILFFGISKLFSSHNRFKAVAADVSAPRTPADEGSISSRIMIWKAALVPMKQHLLGVGTGDVHQELHQLYETNELNYALRLNLNAHNQFVQVFLAIGLPGFLLTLGMFLISGWWTWKNDERVFAAFLLFCFLNFITESILERQAGMLLFSFFYVMFAVRKTQEPPNPII